MHLGGDRDAGTAPWSELERRTMSCTTLYPVKTSSTARSGYAISLYLTESARSRWETAARTNLQAELTRCRSAQADRR